MGLTKNLGWLSKYITADSTGKIGIGTASPNYGLNVVSSDITLSGIVSNRFIGIRKTSNTLPGYLGLLGGDNGDNAKIIGYNGSGTQTFEINASTVPTYFNGGNFGIGTTSPSGGIGTTSTGTLLDIYDGTAIGNNGGALVLSALGNSSRKLNLGQIRTILTDGTPSAEKGDMAFSTMTGSTLSERMRITSGGDVLVGCQAVPGAGGSVQGISLISSGAITALRAAATVGYFGRTNSGELFAFFNNTAQVGNISIGGSSTSYNTSSDYRLKEDIKPVENALERLQDIKPVNFAWKIDGTRVDGFIAHELAEVIPSAVTGEKDAIKDDGTPIYQGIDQSKIVPLLVAAIQELTARLEILENK